MNWIEWVNNNGSSCASCLDVSINYSSSELSRINKAHVRSMLDLQAPFRRACKRSFSEADYLEYFMTKCRFRSRLRQVSRCISILLERYRNWRDKAIRV